MFFYQSFHFLDYAPLKTFFQSPHFLWQSLFHGLCQSPEHICPAFLQSSQI